MIPPKKEKENRHLATFEYCWYSFRYGDVSPCDLPVVTPRPPCVSLDLQK